MTFEDLTEKLLALPPETRLQLMELLRDSVYQVREPAPAPYIARKNPSQQEVVLMTSVTQDALKLSPRERAELAHELLQSLDSETKVDVERLWLDEAESRAAQIDRGEVVPVPGEEVARRARALLK